MPSVFDQVSDRVSAAAAALGASAGGEDASAAKRALWRVFHEFGTAYRRLRREAGVGPIQSVRDAAEAFRREPTLTRLVAVAAELDQHGLMGRSA